MSHFMYSFHKQFLSVNIVQDTVPGTDIKKTKEIPLALSELRVCIAENR